MGNRKAGESDVLGSGPVVEAPQPERSPEHLRNMLRLAHSRLGMPMPSPMEAEPDAGQIPQGIRALLALHGPLPADPPGQSPPPPAHVAKPPDEELAWALKNGTPQTLAPMDMSPRPKFAALQALLTKPPAY